MVITGGAGALGRAVVDAFVGAGAVAHVPVRDRVAPPALSGVHHAVGVDLTDEAAVAAFYRDLPGDLWASVQLAGGFAMAGFTETSLGDLRAQLDLNVVTTFLCCREAVRRFRARPGGGGGRIVNVASRTALSPEGGKVAYSLAKAAVVSLTASLAVELKDDGILVNAVAPGTIDTPANRAAMPGLPARRMVPAADIAAVIVWLASPGNVVGSGAVIPVYGSS